MTLFTEPRPPLPLSYVSGNQAYVTPASRRPIYNSLLCGICGAILWIYVIIRAYVEHTYHVRHYSLRGHTFHFGEMAFEFVVSPALPFILVVGLLAANLLRKFRWLFVFGIASAICFLACAVELQYGRSLMFCHVGLGLMLILTAIGGIVASMIEWRSHDRFPSRIQTVAGFLFGLLNLAITTLILLAAVAAINRIMARGL